MRKLLFTVSAIIMIAGCARLQVVPEQDRAIRNVIPLAMEKGKIFDNTVEWMAKKLSVTGGDIVLKDREKGRIVGKGAGYYYEYLGSMVKRPFSFVMAVDVKDNKYRITYDSISVYYEENTVKNSPVKYRSEFDKIKKRLDDYSSELKGHLEKQLNETEAGKKEAGKEDEW